MAAYGHGGDIYRNKVKIDLSKNVNPLGMPENVKAALIQNVGLYSDYPDPLCDALREKIAAHEGVPQSHILCGNGACELIHALCRAVKPKTGRVFPPTFSEYETALALVGGALSDGAADVTFLCTPNNPTGKLTPTAEIETLARQSKRLILDECFIDFTSAPSFVPRLNDYPNVVVLKAFTKIYAMAGLRLGYIVCADAALTAATAAQIPCWSVSVPAQIAGLAALDNPGWIECTCALIGQERAYLTEAMRPHVRVHDSDANFIFFETDKPVYEAMLAHGILIRRWDETRYRVAVGKHEHNEEFIKWLNRL